ncbi:AsmA family protein [Neolewinella aurantiaca]|uniref:AsmA family protein n=1 Tax=Neolewinella aurantiaca TaxID=2602767 RepID=A0A5C7FPL7_9BACT|nr:translocation/assembly module TamB domain-containing protein [Neolewinella aurantiaca]TXF89668.1 AsmA family protein [Neolewinella aurantiaca]
MAKSISRKILKVLLWTFGIIMMLLLLVFLLLQLPAVQQGVARQVQEIAASSLGTDVGIGGLDIDFPSRIELDDVYVNNPAGDSILRVGHLGVGINMWGLVSSKVQVSDIILKDVFANVVTTDSSSNIQFLLDMATTPDSTASATVSDTTTAAGWVIEASGTELLLERTNIYYQDDPTGILADLEARRLAGKTNEVNLETMRFDIDYLELDGTNALVGIGAGTAPVDTTAATPAAAMQLIAGRVTIQETDFDLRMEEMEIKTGLPYVNLEGANLNLGDSLSFQGELFQTTNLAFRMDTPAPKQEGPGIDYNHLALTDIQAEATDIAYVVDSLHLRLRQLAAKEKSGLDLQRTDGTVIYTPEYLVLDKFTIKTGNSQLVSDLTEVQYNFAGGADLSEMIARLQLDGFLGLKDIAYVAPQMLDIPVVGTNLGQKVNFSVRANGTMAAMELSRVQLDGPGVKVRASGRIENALDMKRIAGRLNLREFSVTPGPLLPLLPDGMLPPDIDWPTKVVAEGNAEYRNDQLQLNLYAIENRQFGNGLQSRIRTSGVIDGVQGFPSTRLNVELDTLLATRPTILAYLPPGTLPEDYRIPDFVRGSGTVSGPMEDLDVNLRLNLPGEETFARINGNIKNALEPENLNLDLEVSDLAINIDDVTAILPDSMLPSNLNIPDLRVRNAKISGSLTNLVFSVPLETDNGNWQLEGKYDPEDLNVDLAIQGVRVPDLFTGPVSDSLRALDLGPVDITASVTGQLEPGMNLLVDATIGGTGAEQWADFNALVQDNNYEADFNFTHPAFMAQGAGAYSVDEDSVASVEAQVTLKRIDLQQWEITEEPMLLRGSLVARSKGLDPYNLDAYVRLDSVFLRGAQGRSFVDSMAITASMHDWDNEIYVRSDVMDAELIGRFDPLKTPEKLTQFVMAYWEEDLRQPIPVENGSELDFVLDLKRPQPLTGGLIDGLTELSPMKMSLLYRDATPSLLFNMDLKNINYAGVEASDLALRVIGDTAALNFEADWSDINYNDQVDLGKTRLSGETVNDEILVELKMYTPADSLRHYLGLYVDPETDAIRAHFEEEQILNFETWTVPGENLITLIGDSLMISDFALQNGRQSLRAETSDPGDIEVVFTDFNLNTPSRLVFPDEEVAGGILNGSVGLDNVMTNPGLNTDLRIDDLSWAGQRLGLLEANATTSDEQNYLVDVSLTEAGNNATVKGNVSLDGPISLIADVKKLQLESAEPFSLGFLTQSEGYLTGKVNIGGTATAPDLDGQLKFVDASLVISLLGERFRVGDESIFFDNSVFNFGNSFKIYDSENGSAVVSGEVRLGDFSNVELDMLVVADDFIAINSTRKDNELYYGKMSVDARVEITGTATVPVLDIVATTNDDSEITYVYTIPGEGLVESEGVVIFSERYQWRDIIRRDILQADSVYSERAGIRMTMDLDVRPNLEVTVIVDPVSGQKFVGRAEGNLTMEMFPDGRQEAVGRVELVEGTYDFIYQKIINKKFDILKGSSVNFTGDLINPQLDLKIRYLAKTSPLALVQGVMGEGADVTGLRRSQTFYVDVGLEGDLQGSRIVTDVTYPEDAYGNLGLSSISDALGTIRQDDSRMTATAFQLLAFNSFNVPLLDQSSGANDNLVNTTITQLMDNYLNSFADQLIGFVELDFGLDSYENESTGETETNLRLSLRKALFDERVIISVDGVAGTSEDELAGTNQTYLDNITAEYLINEDGSFRLKFFNDRDQDILVGGNVIRFGGRLTFSKDFDKIRWFGKKR